MIRKFYKAVDYLFDVLERFWSSDFVRKKITDLLVFTFLISMVVIELNRQGIMPSFLNNIIPKNHFFAVNLAFTLLLVFEIMELVLGLATSVSRSLGKQFEILSLILLRQSFKELVHFEEPIRWMNDPIPIMRIMSDGFGALIIFGLLVPFFRLQKHRPITNDLEEQHGFVTNKKIISLILLLVFLGAWIHSGWKFFTGEPPYSVFTMFFTVLIFADILIVLLSLRYSFEYHVVFRNSGFALSTVLIRFAMTAPSFYNIGLGISSILLAIGLTLAYNTFQYQKSG